MVGGSEVNDVIGGNTINFGDAVPQKLNDAIAIFNKFSESSIIIFSNYLKVPFFALATFWIFRTKTIQLRRAFNHQLAISWG